MKKITTLALSGFLSLALAYNLEEFDGFASPESIYVNNNDVYVSNVGTKLEPLTKDNDGFISKLDKNGNVVDKFFIKNINAPKGMSVIGYVLYVVDIDVLRGFNLKSKKEVFNLPIKNAIFLNDIAIKDNNTLFVSDTGTGIIHLVDLKKKKYSTFVQLDLQKYAGPNGLLINGNNLITVTYDANGKLDGMVLEIDMQNKKMKQISNLRGALDGVVLDAQNNLLVSSWGENLEGKVYKIQNNDFEALDLPDIKGPADMFFDGEFLWIPKMVEGKILKVKL
ncbi:ATP-binding protein [Helicobacter anseris]|uniref:ATP-binding protein n=1 Tax=Helicobacter anseris TaxID=375926 RepID=A0A3D8JC21_9HELI|nr:ATP-binding protein [Helicobacter anseris]RDU74384.1 ATP-binding protein [Helicobacter anseris]